MIVYHYNWEDGDINWEFLNLNWEDVSFKIITDTITVIVSGIGSTVTITKSVLDNITVDVTGVKYNKDISVSVSDVELKHKGVTASNINYTEE